jgi:hypothetical protein
VTGWVEAGRAHPVGARAGNGGVNFSVFSENASRVEFPLFERPDDAEPVRIVSTHLLHAGGFTRSPTSGVSRPPSSWSRPAPDPWYAASWKVRSLASRAVIRQLATETDDPSPAIVAGMIMQPQTLESEMTDHISAAALGSNRELSRRSNHGIEVVLLWCEQTGLLTVCVSDQQQGTYFELHPPPELAPDAFYHPYSYADRGHLYYEDARLAA